MRSHISERDQNVQISDFFFYLCHSRLTSFLFHPLFSNHSREHIYLSVPFPLSHSCIQGNTEACWGFLTVRGRVGWSLSEHHPLLFIRPFTSTLTTWSLKQCFCSSSSQPLELTTWYFPAFFCVFESLCLLHGGWQRRRVWIWNMKVGFSLFDSCKLQTHRSGSVYDEAAVCQPPHPKAKQRLHFILSVCVSRRSPDGGSASLFFHLGGKSFKSKTNQPISAKHKRLNRSWTKPATSNFLVQSFLTVSWSMQVKSDRTVWISTGETGLTVSLYITAPKDTLCDLEGPQPLTPCEREKGVFLFQATGWRTHCVFTAALF